MKKVLCFAALGLWGILAVYPIPGYSQGGEKHRIIDQKVERFLQKMKNQWRDWNVPEGDGKILYRIIMENQYRRALEIGTSTGHSGIWIAWALSKTGGKLITIEIDEGRHRQALANFKEAGLSEYIDARLGDAHQLVKELPGPFEFVFIDAEKEGYTDYAMALVPRLEPGGCITAHNVWKPASRGGYRSGTEKYFAYMKSLPDFETTLHPQSQAGVAVSYKRRK
jgi:predicted O-methyltransferase YrrM